MQKFLKKILSSLKLIENETDTKVSSDGKAPISEDIIEEAEFKLHGHFGHIILWICAIFLVVAIIWANFAVLDEVTTAEGQVIPSQKSQVIQNLEGGIVNQILVQEGQKVKKGQVLVHMDDVKSLTLFKEGEANKVAIELKIARLKAEVNGTTFVIPTELVTKHTELVNSERLLYLSKKREYETLLKQSEFITQEINMTQPLVKLGAISEVEVLRLRQKLNGINREISRFRNASLTELNTARAELSKVQEKNIALKDQLTRRNVRSPVNGIVKQIYISTVGGVVKPGMPLMEIIPTDDTLLVEARVKPKDIGFLYPGQDATVKISAYDFSIYGGLPGKLEHIGADTTVDAKGNSFYEIWVRTPRNYIERDGKKLQIIPGMQVSVDILTGKKTVMDYLLKPILKAKHTALRER